LGRHSQTGHRLAADFFHLVSAVGFEMAVCNLSGAVIGTALATTWGSTFIRKVFFGAVSLLIVSVTGKLALD
jgi:hypothetical protein